MTNRLTPIVAQKQREVAALKADVAASKDQNMLSLLRGETSRVSKKSFKKMLQGPNLAVIAEIKRKSPSKGHLATIDDPLALAQHYIASGASALSILTDEVFFNGSMADLSSVASACAKLKTPILRKDFILDPIQIAQAVVAGADAILAIVAVLGEKTTTIVKAARDMGIDVIVEVHTEAELSQALASGADIIGVNNRNLSTFSVDVERAFQLLPQVPKGIIAIAESGIATPHLARAYHRAGFDAVLMGEALVTADSNELFIRQCRTPLATKVKICGVRSVAMARAAVDAGADWIGIVSHPSSVRHVDLQTGVAIAAVTRSKGAIPVAVFVDQNAQEMKEFCDLTGIEVVQLHGANARHHHAALPCHYQRLYVVSVDDSGMVQDDLAAIATCDAERDYVLFDHVNAGLGQVFPWDKLHYRGPLAVGIAGGVRASNVRAVIARFQPAWIDVSSGVERTPGEKDVELIARLVTTVKQMES